ncbi:hypothetical protein mRhiFer1_008043 [Rhinolophus ferrumequinum]|uniref:Uncharacterized protein n=1 Tax=Rhinolophus ferrumequinum TaxID=59479 RepID=A0A7J7WR96_RHIFE|nr:hypothetical protein mRhiFer1_008043 [Rhinolophus ferrumequinum]
MQGGNRQDVIRTGIVSLHGSGVPAVAVSVWVVLTLCRHLVTSISSALLVLGTDINNADISIYKYGSTWHQIALVVTFTLAPWWGTQLGLRVDIIPEDIMESNDSCKCPSPFLLQKKYVTKAKVVSLVPWKRNSPSS